MNRIVEITLAGKDYKACYTVAADMELEEVCGGMGGIGKYLDAGNACERMRKLCALLVVLLRGGEAASAAMDQLNGMDHRKQDIPTEGQLECLLSPGELLELTKTVLHVISVGTSRTVEAADAKKKALPSG